MFLNRYIAEASPFDSYWGIGMGIDNPLALDKHNWQGKNVMGHILMEVRELLQEQRTKVMQQIIEMLFYIVINEIQIVNIRLISHVLFSVLELIFEVALFYKIL